MKKVGLLEIDLKEAQSKLQLQGGLKQSQATLESQVYILKTQNREIDAKLSICQAELTQVREVIVEGQTIQISKQEHFIKELQDKNSLLTSELSKQKELVLNSERQITELTTQIKALKGEALNIQE